MLPAVTGAWRHPGGGALVHSAGTFQSPHAEMARPELRGDRPNRQVNMVLLGRALAGDLDGEPPLTGLITYNANPMVVAPDTTAVRKGLARDDLFTVSIEQFATDTTRYADVVLPATTQLEHLDVLWSWGHRYLTLNRPAIAPQGQSRPNTEIFRMMANAMADVDDRFSHKSFADDDEELLATYLAAYPIEVADGVRERGWAKVVVSDRPGVKVDLRSERAGALGLDAVPDGRDPEPDDGRFTVVTPKSHHFLNSTFVNHAQAASHGGGACRAHRQRGRRPAGCHRRRKSEAAQRLGRDRGGGRGRRRRAPRDPRAVVQLVGRRLCRRRRRQRVDEPAALPISAAHLSSRLASSSASSTS